MTALLSAPEKKHDRSLTGEEAKRGIYVDFECLVGHPPTLIGFLCEGAFHQVVCDLDLSSAAKASKIETDSAKHALQTLLHRATSERRRIVAYSQFEKTISRDLCEVDLAGVYADARMIAARWLNRLKLKYPNWREEHPGLGIERTLLDFLELINYPRPRNLGFQKTTKRIKDVKAMLQKRESYIYLTRTAKFKWTNLLKHNRHDVLGMSDLVQKATTDYVPI